MLDKHVGRVAHRARQQLQHRHVTLLGVDTHRVWEGIGGVGLIDTCRTQQNCVPQGGRGWGKQAHACEQLCWPALPLR
eukprot:363513-Chlamydomonas_euryale.AAC.2